MSAELDAAAGSSGTSCHTDKDGQQPLEWPTGAAILARQYPNVRRIEDWTPIFEADGIVVSVGDQLHRTRDGHTSYRVRCSAETTTATGPAAHSSATKPALPLAATSPTTAATAETKSTYRPQTLGVITAPFDDRPAYSGE
jgi:hypothetical protein